MNPNHSQPPTATVQAVKDRTQKRSAATGGTIRREDGRLQRIIAGEFVPPEVHPEVFRDPPVLEMDKFDLWYGSAQALFDVTMPVPAGKVTSLIGPSGCGKSTLLRCVNRMNDLIDGVRTKGDMRLSGESIFAPGVDVIELRKRMGMVFQKPNPFPMSIFDNVVYSLRIDGERNRQVLAEVCERSLRGAALWDEVKDRAAGRAVLGTRPFVHRKDRGSDQGLGRPLLDPDRHSQHAAGGPGQRLHGVHVPGTSDRVRADGSCVHEPTPA